MVEHPRKLKVLVIHDTMFLDETPKEVLGTADLSLCEISFRTGRQAWVLRNWVDVIRVLGGLAGGNCEQGAHIETPDLLLLDCNFAEDQGAPRLVRGEFDPRGLLYGAVLAAYFLGAQPARPFSFVPYSQNMTRAASSSHAQTLYSLLQAMLGEIPEVIEPAHYSRTMSSHTNGQTPARVVADALQRYRISLDQAFIDDLMPDINSFESALPTIDGYLVDGVSLPDDLVVSWTSASGRRESVLLTSLFADCRSGRQWIRDDEEREAAMAWGSVEGSQVRKFLQDVVDQRNHYKDVLEPTLKIMRAIAAGKEDCWDDCESIDRCRVLALTIHWALDRCRACFRNKVPEKRVVGRLLRKLGLDSTPMNRALGAILRPSNTGQEEARFKAMDFVALLDRSNEWPFASPAWLPRLVVRYLERSDVSHHPDRAPEYWPKCLQGYRRQASSSSS